MAAENEKKIIGIDLGTTYHCVAVWQRTAADVIINEHCNRKTPSIIAFSNQERLFGEQAAGNVNNTIANTVFGVKRLIGKRFKDSVVQKHMQWWPFKVICGEQGEPLIEIKYKNDYKKLSPEEVTAMLLSKIKSLAEQHLQTSVESAVISVPSNFNDSQRKATKDAALIAGFKDPQLITETCAIALAYGHRQDVYFSQAKKTILVFDLGGGTFDVSVVTVQRGCVEVKATCGDTDLGGDDFDTNVVTHLATLFKAKYQTKVHIEAAPKALRRLRLECEKAKKRLSTTAKTIIDIDSIHEGVDYEVSLSREDFESLNNRLIRRFIELTEQCLEDSKVKPGKIDDIILVGGSTRIPKLQSKLMELFPGKTFCKSINADEAVAIGAAIKAADLNNELSQRPIKVADAMPFGLRVHCSDDLEHQIFERNMTLPCTNYLQFPVDLKFSKYSVKVSQVNAMKDISFLFECVFLPSVRGVHVLAFNVDGAGLLSVSANHILHETACKTYFLQGGSRLTEDQIDEKYDAMKQFEADDMQAIHRHVAMNGLQEYVLKKKSELRSVKKGESVSKATEILNGVEDWIDDNGHAEVVMIEDKMKGVKQEIDNLHFEATTTSVKKELDNLHFQPATTPACNLQFEAAKKEADNLQFQPAATPATTNEKEIDNPHLEAAPPSDKISGDSYIRPTAS